jgi:hypothetical protein
MNPKIDDHAWMIDPRGGRKPVPFWQLHQWIEANLFILELPAGEEQRIGWKLEDPAYGAAAYRIWLDVQIAEQQAKEKKTKLRAMGLNQPIPGASGSMAEAVHAADIRRTLGGYLGLQADSAPPGQTLKPRGHMPAPSLREIMRSPHTGETIRIEPKPPAKPSETPPIGLEVPEKEKTRRGPERIKPKDMI